MYWARLVVTTSINNRAISPASRHFDDSLTSMEKRLVFRDTRGI
jgi:hypothetical protein